MTHLDDLLFIDESSHRGFCSEECIEDFYFPFIKHFEIIETSLRAKHNLSKENGPVHIVDPEMVEEVLAHPNEVFRQSNELDEAFYHFIKHFPDFSVVVISSVYRKEASFVFLTTKTKSQVLLNEFRYGEMVTDWNAKSDDDDDDEDEEYQQTYKAEALMDDFEEEDEDMIFIQLLESKKSKLLADILMNRRDDDIAFEDYSGYESCFQETLDFPDEVFEKKDNEGDVIFTYIKSFDKFFYIVSCLKRKIGEDTVNVYPILALPTTDVKMCQEFRGGTRLTGPLKN